MVITNPYDHLNEQIQDIRSVLTEIAENQTAKTPVPIILTGDQLKEKLNITRQTLARWRKQNRIPYFQVGGIVRYDYWKVIEALEANQNKKGATV